MTLTGETSTSPETASDAAVMPRTVLFDFDGVLFQGDSFRVYITERYARAPLRKLLACANLPWMLLVWPISWRTVVRSLVHIGLLGVGERRYTAEAQSFAAALVRRPRQFYRDGLQALRRHQAAGDRVIVVTGCERTLARGILDQLGLEGLELLASEFKPGPFGMRVKFHNVGRRKLERLAAHGVREWQLAYSDSLADIPMLKGAGEAVLVNGTPKVCKRLEKVLGRSVTRVEWF
jgi:phosphatidylglycerophosphatase C